MPYVLTNGVNIYYESHGQGFPLVLAYGLGGNTTEWAPQVTEFSQRYRLILWDPRGHGRSDSPANLDQYGNGTSAWDLLGILDHLGIERAYVGGLSMGAGISVRFALVHPERVEALLIIDSASASGLPQPKANLRMRERIIHLALSEGMEAVADYSIKSNPNITHTAQQSPQAEESIRQMYRALNPIGYAHSTKATIYATFNPDLLKALKMPTLVLAGSEDPAVGPCRVIHEKISGSKMVILQGAGHLSNLDQPQAFNEAVLSFLAGVDSQRGI